MKSTRKAYGEALVELGKTNKDVIVLDADLAHATCTVDFKLSFPERHINVGISEQDLVGTAVGLSLGGKVVYASSFAMFLAGRAYEQIRNSVCYPNIPVRLCATHSGLSVGEDGATHQCLEDISLMRGIPNMTVLSPSDEWSTKNIIKMIENISGPVYVRLGRADVENIYSETDKFEIGGSKTFGNGKAATVFATGATVHMSLVAKEILFKKGIDIRVIDIYSIKPIDKDVILKAARETSTLLSIEDHSVIGGIGAAISDILIEYNPKRLIKIGAQDKFGKSGKGSELLDLYGVSAENIVNKIIEDIAKQSK